MIKALADTYWTKSKAFLLPLTGIHKPRHFVVDTYLFWESYSIQDYVLTVKFTYGQLFPDFMDYLRNNIFKDSRRGHIIESYDYDGFTIMIFDISEWAFDIEQFLKGKYSKFTQEAKDIVHNYHRVKDEAIPWMIMSALYPNKKMAEIGNVTFIEYVATNYGLPLGPLQKLGELGSIYDKDKETLILTDTKEGQNDRVLEENISQNQLFH